MACDQAPMPCDGAEWVEDDIPCQEGCGHWDRAACTCSDNCEDSVCCVCTEGMEAWMMCPAPPLCEDGTSAVSDGTCCGFIACPEHHECSDSCADNVCCKCMDGSEAWMTCDPPQSCADGRSPEPIAGTCCGFQPCPEHEACTLSDGTQVPDGWSGKGRVENYCNDCACHTGVLQCTLMACDTSGFTLSDGTRVPNGWSGQGRGTNYCNHCSCEAGALACTEMACDVTDVPQSEDGGTAGSDTEGDTGKYHRQGIKAQGLQEVTGTAHWVLVEEQTDGESSIVYIAVVGGSALFLVLACLLYQCWPRIRSKFQNYETIREGASTTVEPL